MSQYESSWNPGEYYYENSPGLREYSIGLLQLSMNDQNSYQSANLSPRISQESQLTDPTLNLQWGVTIFAFLVRRYAVVASGAGSGSRGAARYWSVLWAGHKIELIKTQVRKYVGL